MTWAEAKPIVDSIEGYLIEGQAEWLFNKAASLPRCAEAIEIGCYHGKSSVAIMAGLSNVNGHLCLIDTDTSIAAKNAMRLGLDCNFSFQTGDSAVRMATAPLSSFDFVFIDASHRLSNVLVDFALSYRALKQGGWLVLHDYDPQFPDVRFVWDKLEHLLSNRESCHSIRAGQKLREEQDTP